MAHPDVDTMLMLERRRNDLAAAQHDRLINSALAWREEKRAARVSFRPAIIFQSVLHLAGQALYQLGMRFQGWGCQLQVRYATGGRNSQAAPCD